MALGAEERGLAVVSTVRSDGSVQASLVNAGIVAHPATAEPVVAFVTNGPVKLANPRARPQLAITFRNGWRWASVEGTAQLTGPDDPVPWVDADSLRRLLRRVFTAAGGIHDDWEEYDRVMAAQRRAVVLITPTRVYGTG